MATTPDYDVAALLASPVRRSLLEAIQRQERERPDEPGMTAAELAPLVGLHVTTVRFHLDRLVAADVLRAQTRPQRAAGRPRKVYMAADGATGEGGPIRLLAALLAEAVATSAEGEAITPAEAGRRWARANIPAPDERTPARSPGAYLARVGEMIDVLEQWGYELAVSTADGGRTARLELTDCPFLDLARANPAVVCGVHRALIAEAMVRFGETSTDVTLEPFVTPTRCLAHVRTATPFHAD